MAGGLMATGNLQGAATNTEKGKLPREVWIGTVSQEKMEVRNKEENVETILGFLEEMKSHQPDIICLPEVFTRMGSTPVASYKDTAETKPYPSLAPMTSRLLRLWMSPAVSPRARL